MISLHDDFSHRRLIVKDNGPLFPPPREDLILGHNAFYPRDVISTWVNNNVLIIGSSGSGKTRGIIEPNIRQAYGSYVISDPKGALYKKYADYLSASGVDVKCLNLSDPSDPETDHYNPIHYCKTEQDILSLSHLLCWTRENDHIRFGDTFWEQSGELLYNAVIGYVFSYVQGSERNLSTVFDLLQGCIPENDYVDKSPLDYVFEEIPDKGSSFPYKQYKLFRQAAGRTLRSIVITVSAKIGRLMTPQVCSLTSYDTLDLEEIGHRKTAIFLVVSDTDRSMDMLASVFLSQLFQILIRSADSSPDRALPTSTTVVLDDFASGVYIESFDRLISSMRSRNLSVMLATQSLAQLESLYGPSARTIVGNCDNIVFMGSDIETARYIADMGQLPRHVTINIPRHHEIILRRGETPIMTQIIDPDAFIYQRAGGGSIGTR